MISVKEGRALDTSFNYLYNNQTNYHDDISRQTGEVFKALVNAIIPRTPGLAYEYGIIQYYGALDSYVDEFVMLQLDSLELPFAQNTAEMLNSVASSFNSINQYNLLYVLTLLIQLQVNLSYLPLPFRDNPLLVNSITNSIINNTTMGYYSEWSGYGSTRLAEPNQRKLEYYPLSWSQVGYPGPSLGYRALRVYSFD